LGTFSGWNASKNTTEIHNLVIYLARWVGNVKVIFISLLIVIMFLGDNVMQWWSVLVLDLTIILFWVALFPLIRRMDANGQLTSEGYSKKLATMIFFMQLFLSIGLFLVNPWNPIL
jgi:hypothetical protein